MEEKKKLCVFSLVKNGIVFLFLLLMMLMPVEEIGIMGNMHFSMLLILFDGGASGADLIFCIFGVAFILLWILSLVYIVVNIVYAVKGMKNPAGITVKKMKKTFDVSLSVCAYIMNILSQILLYIGIISADSLGRISFFILFVLFIVVIVLGVAGKKKTRKAFMNESPKI